jgi:hypothetical protein
MEVLGCGELQAEPAARIAGVDHRDHREHREHGDHGLEAWRRRRA